MTTFTAYGRVDAEHAGYTLFSGSAHSTTYTKGELALTIRDNREAELFAVMRGLKLTTQTISFPNTNLEVFEHLILKMLAFQEKPYLVLEVELANHKQNTAWCAELVRSWRKSTAEIPDYCDPADEASRQAGNYCASSLAALPEVAKLLEGT